MREERSKREGEGKWDGRGRSTRGSDRGGRGRTPIGIPSWSAVGRAEFLLEQRVGTTVQLSHVGARNPTYLNPTPSQVCSDTKQESEAASELIPCMT